MLIGGKLRSKYAGEHIDYALFGVFPAAIEADILIACGTSPSANQGGDRPQINLQNFNPKYLPSTFSRARSSSDLVESDPSLKIDTTHLKWESYVKAAYLGTLAFLRGQGGDKEGGLESGEKEDWNLLIDGRVPAGSGLSSSAALVVSATLTFLLLSRSSSKQHPQIAKSTLVSLSIESEKRVGINSGGMDQSASILAQGDAALYIDFYPSVKAEVVRVPGSSSGKGGYAWVIAHSCVVSDKVVSREGGYNLRVFETRVGARLLASALGLPTSDKPLLLREVVQLYIDKEASSSKKLTLAQALDEFITQVDLLFDTTGLPPSDPSTLIPKVPVTIEDLVRLSGLPQDNFTEIYLQSKIDPSRNKGGGFLIRERTRHVLEEARRVLEFRELCRDRDGDSGSENLKETMERLGSLMNASQKSCDTLFDCSCPEIGQITGIARAAGALGSRLTGAGWGGSTISLVENEKVKGFFEKLKEEYEPYKKMGEEEFAKVVFATGMGAGAGIWVV